MQHNDKRFLKRESFCWGRQSPVRARRRKSWPRNYASADLQGELFRHNIGARTPLGLEAKRYLDAGDLVPSSLTNALVDDRLNDEDAKNGFILDGFPRSVEQAEALRQILDARGTRLNAVQEFKVSEDLLRDRFNDRGRADDTEDVILNRMKVYRDETAPLVD